MASVTDLNRRAEFCKRILCRTAIHKQDSIRGYIHNKKFEFDLSRGAPENCRSGLIAVPLFHDEESYNLENQKICVPFSTAKIGCAGILEPRGTGTRAANRAFLSSRVATWS